MTCYHPIVAYQHKFLHSKNGKHLIDFKGGSVREWDEIKLPCGRCIGCRLERSRQWAIRCVHESQYHDENMFLTLTFDDDHLDPEGSLRKSDFVLFMKRLRKYFDSQGKKIRFFHCGEYGSLYERPHHHAIIFGADFSDKVLWSTSCGFPLFRSKSLEKLWPYGFSSIAGVSFESCAYVARYVTKKITGDAADEHYHGREPEYVTMSRMPGIGYQWLLDHPEIYNFDEVVIRNGIKCKPPRYYDKIFDQIAPDYMEYIKNKRKLKASELDEKNRIPNRLAQKEDYKIEVCKKLIRKYESEN